MNESGLYLISCIMMDVNQIDFFLKYEYKINCPFNHILSKFLCRPQLDCYWSEVDILKLAAGVESNTIHPIGKAIVAAARAVNAPTVKVVCQLQSLLFFVKVVYD